MAAYRHAVDVLDAFDLADPWGVRMTLRTGLDSDPPPGAPEPEVTEEILALAWGRLREQLIAETRAEDPATRPEGYWALDAPSDPAAGGAGPDSLDAANEMRLPALLEAGEVDGTELAELFAMATPPDRATHDGARAAAARRRTAIVRDHLIKQTDERKSP